MKTIVLILISLLCISSVMAIGIYDDFDFREGEDGEDPCGNGICEVIYAEGFVPLADESDPESEFYCPVDCEPAPCPGCGVDECEALGLIMITDCPPCTGGGGGCSLAWCESQGYISTEVPVAFNPSQCEAMGYTKNMQPMATSSTEEGSKMWWVPWLIIVALVVVIIILWNKKEKKSYGTYKGGKCIPCR